MNKAETAATIRRFADFFKGLAEVADTLDVMQTHEESAKAAEQRVAQARETLVSMTSDMASASAALGDLKERSMSVVTETQRQIDTMIADATARAQQIEAQAQDEAYATVRAGTAESDARIAAASEQLVSIGAQLADMAARRDELAAQIEARSAEVASLEEKLAAARAAAAAVLGG